MGSVAAEQCWYFRVIRMSVCLEMQYQGVKEEGIDLDTPWQYQLLQMKPGINVLAFGGL